VIGNCMLLIFPPGWSQNISGCHIAVPLLKAFLKSKGVLAEQLDLNIGVSEYYGVSISESSVVSACRQPSLFSLNSPYFQTQDRLHTIAAGFNGDWEIQRGYRPEGYDPASSESIRLFSQKPSPFTSYYTSEVIPSIMKDAPSVIGFSVTVPGQLQPTFELCRLLRDAGYNGKLIIGGNTVTRIGDKLFLDWVFDIIDGIILYQGEYALLEIWKSLQANREFDSVPNLTWQKNDRIISNNVRLLEPKDFKGPDFQGLPIDNYWGVSYLPMIGARGCYYSKCSFCAIPYAWGPRGYIGRSEAVDVLNDMKCAYELYGLNRFRFVEESLHPKLIAELVNLINAESFECYFEGYARFDRFWCNRTFLEKAAKAGLQKVYIGLELAPSKLRESLNKSNSTGYIETLAALAEFGIKTHLFCMFGYPGTGTEEAYNTIEFILDNREMIDSIDIAPFFYAKHTHVPGIKSVINEAKDWAIEYEYIPESEGVLYSDQAIELSRQLEELIWREQPLWLHPIYRMYSPWQNSLHGT